MRIVEFEGNPQPLRFLFGAVLAALALLRPGAMAAATITVTSAADNTTVDGAVTLREAMTSINNAADLNADVTANRTGTYGTSDTINFNISGTGVKTIALASSLPPVTKPVTINGYTQGVASANTLAVGDNAVLLIEIDGTNGSSPTLALTTGSSGSTVTGLVINRFPGEAILIQNGSGGDTISGNFIGTNPAGTVSSGASTAVDINFSAGNANVVGG